MNKSVLAGIGAATSASVAALTVSGGRALINYCKKLKANAHTTDIPGVDGQPFSNSHYYKEGDYSIHYRIDRATTPEVRGKIFMIHGFACNTTFYDEMVEIYTRYGFTCVRPDAPDCGYSTRENRDVSPLNREDLFFHIMEKLDASGEVPAGKWFLMGHSMGGGISMNMANMCPEKFNSVVLYAPMAAVNAPTFVKKIVTLKPMCDLMDALFIPAASNDAIMKAVVMLMTVDVRYSILYDVRKFSDGLTVPGSGAGMCYMMARARPTIYSDMSNVKLPIQLVWGAMDLFNTKGTKRKFQGALTNPEVSTVVLAGHCLVQNAAREVCDGTMEFYSKNSLL